MRLSAKVKLLANSEQFDLLKSTIETVNLAANYVSECAWNNKCFSRYDLHKLVYYDIRARFSLGSQSAVLVIGKVTDAYKLDKKTKRKFKNHGVIGYDCHYLTWKEVNSTSGVITIWVMGGRIKVPFICGARQGQMLLETIRGEARLMLCGTNFYLSQACDIKEADPINFKGLITSPALRVGLLTGVYL